jgi:hypothetical protein
MVLIGWAMRVPPCEKVGLGWPASDRLIAAIRSVTIGWLGLMARLR